MHLPARGYAPDQDQSRFAKIAKYKNSRSANPLRILLTACNIPQRASSRSASADRLSSAELNNCLLVGRITISVNGMTDKDDDDNDENKDGYSE